jgi:putative ABC transport system ATP-binding protein
MKNQLTITKAKKHYKLGGENVKALDGINLTIQEGEFLAIVGPSGSGKSTLMHVIGGIDKLDSGVLSFEGKEINEMNDRELSMYRNQTVGFVFQTFNLQPNLTALENVELPLVFSGTTGSSRRKRAVEALKKVGLGERLDHKPGELSGGQRQRVSIARALVNEPRIIVADEPTGNLDSKTGNEIIKLMEKVSEDSEITLLVVTHDDRIAKRADRIIHILDGRLEKESKGGINAKSKYID